MLPGLNPTTVIRMRAATSVNSYGDDSTDWSNPNEILIDGCAFQPAAGQEFLDQRDAVVSRWSWYGPRDADVTPFDRIRVDGVVYDIDGSVQAWDDPSGRMSHKFAVCRRSDG